MAGDEAGNGPPRPEEGPATISDPGEALDVTLKNPCNSHVAPPCNTSTTPAAAGVAPPHCQAGGQVQADLGVGFPTFSPLRIPTNPTLSLAPPKLLPPLPPTSFPVVDPGLSIQPQPSLSDQAQGHRSTELSSTCSFEGGS
ncbi:hypothetical protein LIER_40755 [Lithospermum erythrorhizon]|uniref:Uncharacterized protein n=1 Tax=Lithospermum erythrorhizon TaxID=34254 RepID=A0AAV3R0E8_LITER